MMLKLLLMDDKVRNLYDYLNSKHGYYVDFIRYEQFLGNNKNADVLDARASEVYFIMNELLRILNEKK